MIHRTLRLNTFSFTSDHFHRKKIFSLILDNSGCERVILIFRGAYLYNVKSNHYHLIVHQIGYICIPAIFLDPCSHVDITPKTSLTDLPPLPRGNSHIQHNIHRHVFWIITFYVYFYIFCIMTKQIIRCNIKTAYMYVVQQISRCENWFLTSYILSCTLSVCRIRTLTDHSAAVSRPWRVHTCYTNTPPVEHHSGSAIMILWFEKLPQNDIMNHILLNHHAWMMLLSHYEKVIFPSTKAAPQLLVISEFLL